MSEEELISLVRNHNMTDEQIVKLAHCLLSEICNKSEEKRHCYLCGGSEEYMGEACAACNFGG